MTIKLSQLLADEKMKYPGGEVTVVFDFPADNVSDVAATTLAREMLTRLQAEGFTTSIPSVTPYINLTFK